MNTPKNLEEGKPIQQNSLDLEAVTEDSTKYLIQISIIGDKLTLTTSYKNGII